jgi:hypothetical protein
MHRFSRFLARWVAEKHLDNEMSAMGEVMAFPMLAITCTPGVTEKIVPLPEVDAVVPDVDAFHCIR